MFPLSLTVLFQNMIHIAESTVGRRYAGWFIKNTERTIRIFEDLKNTPLPTPPAKTAASNAAEVKISSKPKVAWGGAKVVA